MTWRSTQLSHTFPMINFGLWFALVPTVHLTTSHPKTLWLNQCGHEVPAGEGEGLNPPNSTYDAPLCRESESRMYKMNLGIAGGSLGLTIVNRLGPPVCSSTTPIADGQLCDAHTFDPWSKPTVIPMLGLTIAPSTLWTGGLAITPHHHLCCKKRHQGGAKSPR